MTMEHVLFTALGKRAIKAEYELDGHGAACAQLASIALCELLPKDRRPTLVRAFCTKEAKATTWPILESELRGRVEVECVDIPDGDGQDAIDEFLRCFADSVPRQGALTLDVTHGFRHLPFLMFVGALYVSALREVDVKAVYYARLNQNSAPSPFLDLRRLFDLTRWVHALETFGETGSALPIANLIERDESQSAKSLVRDLRRIFRYHAAGLPIELGNAARLFLAQRPQPLQKRLQKNLQLPLSEEVMGRFTELLQPLALPTDDVSAGWKSRLRLDEQELQRQARLIDDLFERENIPAAVGLLREWTISWAAWVQDGGKDWLKCERRKPAESLLHTLAAFKEDKSLRDRLSDEQRELATFWANLRGVRNSLHHHGMRRQVIFGEKSNSAKELDRARKYWEQTLSKVPRLKLLVGRRRYRALLVSPLGQASGVLFSAVGACREKELECDACLVICSPETEGLVEEGLARANFEAGEENVTVLRLKDPHAGLGEIERLIGKAQQELVGAAQVFVNVTGGTTLMGLVAERVAKAAQGMGLPVRRFGLIDKRPREEQLADPYQQSEVLWLEEADRDGDH